MRHMEIVSISAYPNWDSNMSSRKNFIAPKVGRLLHMSILSQQDNIKIRPLSLSNIFHFVSTSFCWVLKSCYCHCLSGCVSLFGQVGNSITSNRYRYYPRLSRRRLKDPALPYQVGTYVGETNSKIASSGLCETSCLDIRCNKVTPHSAKKSYLCVFLRLVILRRCWRIIKCS